jgi:hypothetical protein
MDECAPNRIHYCTSARSLKQKKQSGHHHAPPTPKANTPNCAFGVLEQVLFMLTCHRYQEDIASESVTYDTH